MADYKLTRLPDCKGQMQYEIRSIYEWDDTRVSWDYEKIEKIVETLEVGEEHILHI